MPAGGRCDVAGFDGHTPAGLFEPPFLFRPYAGNGHIESVNSPAQRFHKPWQPGLEGLALLSILGAHPISQLRDDDGAGVEAVLLLFEPGDDPRIAVALGRLAGDLAGTVRRRFASRVTIISGITPLTRGARQIVEAGSQIDLAKQMD